MHGPAARDLPRSRAAGPCLLQRYLSAAPPLANTSRNNSTTLTFYYSGVVRYERELGNHRASRS